MYVLLPFPAGIAGAVLLAAMRQQQNPPIGHWLAPAVGIGLVLFLAVIHLLLRAMGRAGILRIDYPSPGAFRVRGLFTQVQWRDISS